MHILNYWWKLFSSLSLKAHKDEKKILKWKVFPWVYFLYLTFQGQNVANEDDNNTPQMRVGKIFEQVSMIHATLSIQHLFSITISIRWTKIMIPNWPWKSLRKAARLIQELFKLCRWNRIPILGCPYDHEKVPRKKSKSFIPLSKLQCFSALLGSLCLTATNFICQ